jgi:hypothetical protein
LAELTLDKIGDTLNKLLNFHSSFHQNLYFQKTNFPCSKRAFGIQVFYRNCTGISQELVYFSREKSRKEKSHIPKESLKICKLLPSNFQLPKRHRPARFRTDEDKAKPPKPAHGPQH